MTRCSVYLCAEGMTSGELYTEWLRYQGLRDEAAKGIEALVTRWRYEPDPTVRNRLSVEYQAVVPQFEVLEAWTELFHTAWVFATRGCRSRFLPEEVSASGYLMSI